MTSSYNSLYLRLHSHLPAFNNEFGTIKSASVSCLTNCSSLVGMCMSVIPSFWNLLKLKYNIYKFYSLHFVITAIFSGYNNIMNIFRQWISHVMIDAVVFWLKLHWIFLRQHSTAVMKQTAVQALWNSAECVITSHRRLVIFYI